MDNETRNQQLQHPTGSSNGSGERLPPKHMSQDHQGLSRPAWISAKARQVLSAYRRDDFADPENFLVQLGMVLERYPDNIIEPVTSPITGIQRKVKFPPSIAEIVEACDGEMARAARLERYREMGQRTPRAPQGPVSRANIFVPADNVLYPEMADRSTRPDSHYLEFTFNQKPPGIWVAECWLPRIKFA